MATRNMTGTIQVRRDTAANWESRNPILKAGEFGFDTTSNIVKIGDGSTAWENLVGLMRNYIVYGVKIARTNSNPATAITYTDDAVGFAPATASSAGSWADKYPFNQIRPCLLKDGEVIGYLNPNNYAQYENGAAATIDSITGGDVMVEFPKCYYKFSQDDSFTYVQISNSPASMIDGFTDWAFSYKGSVKDKFYMGAYKAYFETDKLYSLSGKTPTVNKTIGAFRTAAHARGGGYEITPYNKLTLLQALYLIRFKSLNSQSALGQGYVSGSSPQATGATNANGLYYGSTSGTSQVKCHGLEDFWGNVSEWVDGLEQSNKKLYISDGNFNDTAADYTIAADLPSSISGYTNDVRGDSKLGFLITQGGGSSSTYFSDYGYCDVSSGVFVAYFGGYYGDGSNTGAFYLSVYFTSSGASGYIGARLCFCG